MIVSTSFTLIATGRHHFRIDAIQPQAAGCHLSQQSISVTCVVCNGESDGVSVCDALHAKDDSVLQGSDASNVDPLRFPVVPTVPSAQPGGLYKNVTLYFLASSSSFVYKKPTIEQRQCTTCLPARTSADNTITPTARTRLRSLSRCTFHKRRSGTR